jgi:diguanylate cyclase (GGDEF)-like protein
MKIAPTPKNETERLAAMHKLQILDTPREPRFDRYTRLACQLFDVPSSAICLIDSQRQWFKSTHGFYLEESPRDISFCAHAILQDSIFEVSDAREDQRFHDNPFVTKTPYVRYYAGAPLKATGGHLVGTMILLDTRPNKLSPEQEISLLDMARMVSDELGVYTDELTGLANRKALVSVLENISDLQNNLAQQTVLAVFDLDNFKLINDQHGHKVGDEALRAFAHLLCDTFRKLDVKFRLGGDEFCVLLPGASEATAVKRVEKLRAQVDQFNRKTDLPFALEFSVGVYSTDPQIASCSVGQLFAAADRLMYQNKARRKASTQAG